jgi:hypothetical protein
VRKGKNGPQLAVGFLGKSTKDHPRLFRGSLLGNVPTRVEAFPWRYLCEDAARASKPWTGYPCLRASK